MGTVIQTDYHKAAGDGMIDPISQEEKKRGPRPTAENGSN